MTSGGAAVRQHVRPHPRIHIDGALDSVAGGHAARVRRRPAHLHLALVTGRGGQGGGGRRHLGQGGGGSRHRHRRRRQPIGATGTRAEAQHPIPAPARRLGHQVQGDSGVMRRPGVRHRRRGRRPLVRRQRIRRCNPQRRLRARGAGSSPRGLTYAHPVAGTDLVVVGGGRGQAAVTPGHRSGAAVSQHLGPHPGPDIGRPFNPVAREGLRAGIRGRRPAELHLAVRPWGHGQSRGQPRCARRRRGGNRQGRPRAPTRAHR